MRDEIARVNRFSDFCELVRTPPQLTIRKDELEKQLDQLAKNRLFESADAQTNAGNDEGTEVGNKVQSPFKCLLQLRRALTKIEVLERELSEAKNNAKSAQDEVDALKTKLEEESAVKNSLFTFFQRNSMLDC